MYTKAYFKNFAGMSINTDQWKAFLFGFIDEYFGEEKVKLLKTVEWDKWLNAPGVVRFSKLFHCKVNIVNA
jgi:leukotriene-A4 hydrolase